MKPRIESGARVAYSVQFLRSIGMSHSPMAHARGIVVELVHLSAHTCLARIEWEKGADMPARVHVKNLAIVGANRKFSNVD